VQQTPETAAPGPAFVPVEKARVRALIAARLTGTGPKPTKVGRYTLGARLGHGAFGVVYRAHDPKLNREVAVKLMLAPDPKRAQALLAEAHALARLSHPNVVSVFDAGEADRAVFIAMEYVPGRTLSAWLEEPGHSSSDTIGVMLDAGRGLASAHAAGLVHRDFKPDNVMVGEDGRVRVLDFGLARPVEPHLHQADGTTPAGTPGYMAPEQRAGESPTAKSDQYAFCVTFHEALTRRRPDNRRWSRWARAIAKPIIAKGLRARPEERHPSLDALIRRFERRRTLALVAALASAMTLGAALMWSLLT
jgi:serine/threonine protein kinase